jgi:hypothetical protein
MSNSNSKTALPEPQAIYDKKEKRALVQQALDRFSAGQATEADYNVFRNRGAMVSSTAEQACRFLEASAGRQVPFDIHVIWANILRERWYQAQSGRRTGAMLSQELVSVPTLSTQ